MKRVQAQELGVQPHANPIAFDTVARYFSTIQSIPAADAALYIVHYIRTEALKHRISMGYKAKHDSSRSLTTFLETKW